LFVCLPSAPPAPSSRLVLNSYLDVAVGVGVGDAAG
jgi:hypothetical protein